MFITTLIKIFSKQKITDNMAKKHDSTATKSSDNYINKLIKDDNNISVGNFFLVATTIIGLLLLIVPLFALIIEAWFNHTIATDLNGMAAYILAVVGIFAAGGATHGWTEYSWNKFNAMNKDQDTGSEYLPKDVEGTDEEHDETL